MPEVYELGMSNYGLRILYSIINRLKDALCDRCFAPWPDFGAVLRKRGEPLFGLESGRPVSEFDVFGLSLQSEGCYTNVPYVLELAGIPLHREERDAGCPLVVAGGPCTVNPLPLCGFIDAFVVGDGEEVVRDITAAVAAWDHRHREDLLSVIAGIGGVFVPGYSSRESGSVKRRFVDALTEEDFPAPPLVPVCAVTHDRLTIEIARGCTRGCRFCQAGMCNRPVRFRPVEDILRIAERGVRATGWEEISLLSLSALDYPDLLNLVQRLNAQFHGKRVALSLPSTRGEDFTPELAFDLKAVKKTGLTFAPETASTRLKALVNKDISELRTLEAIRTALDAGWNGVKLYFMVGLPTETDADLDEIVRFVGEVGRLCRSRAVRYSLSPFVPKPHTPLQWAGFAGMEEVRHKVRFVKSQLTRRNLKAKWEEPENSFVQAFLARGDERLGPVIERVYRAGGLFQEWSEHFDFARWQAALDAEGVDPVEYNRARPASEPLPWDFIDVGVDKEFLLAEHERSERGGTTEDCAEGTCTGCGVCPDNEPPPRPERSDPVEGAYRRRSAVVPVAGGANVRVRLKHTVTGAFRYAGHLDRVRALYRALRRSELPVAYTRGYSPKPMLSFGPPLPVGVTSDGEYFDVFLSYGYSGNIIRDLGPFMPRGLRLTAARGIVRARSTLGKEINLGRYRVGLPPGSTVPTEAAPGTPGVRAIRATGERSFEMDLTIAPGVKLFAALVRLTEIEEPAIRALDIERLDCLIEIGGVVKTPLED
jgi:radical SAM family uncharacterized protein